MKNLKMMSAFTLVAVFAVGSFAQAEETLIPSPPPVKPKELKDDEADSCSTNLCLGQFGKDLAECEGPLKKLQDMKKKSRPDYLAKCPKGF